MKLPKKLFVSIQGEGIDQYFQASRSVHAAMGDDGPIEVGEYQLVSRKTYEKKITELK